MSNAGFIRELFSRRDKFTLNQVGQTLMVGAVGISALFGGLDTVQEEDTSTVRVAAHQTYEGNRLHVAVHRAVLANALPGMYDPEPGMRYLGVVATMENVSDEPTVAARLAVSLPGIDGAKPEADQALLTRDNSMMPNLQPNIPEDVTLAFAVPANAFHEGDPLTLHIRDWNYLAKTEFTYGGGWVDTDKHGEVTVAVQDGDTR